MISLAVSCSSLPLPCLPAKIRRCKPEHSSQLTKKGTIYDAVFGMTIMRD